MKRRNFIKNTGLTIAGMAINNHIYSKNSSAKKSLNIIILISGGVQYHDIIDIDKVDFNVLFQNHIPMLVNCNTQLKYTGEILEHAPAVLSVLQGIKGNNERKLFFGNINSETINYHDTQNI